MERNVEYFKGIVKEIKFPKVNLPKINLRNMQKPPRWIVVSIAILIEIILLYFILWLFDERTVFNNDYFETRYSNKTLVWGWFHIGTVVTFILGAIALFIAIIIEFIAWEEKGRTFYNLYR